MGECAIVTDLNKSAGQYPSKNIVTFLNLIKPEGLPVLKTKLVASLAQKRCKNNKPYYCA